jgi:hypothetical protein
MRKPHGARRSRDFDLKRTKGKGDEIMRPCLGSGCDEIFLTTPETRLCKRCKRNLIKLEGVEAYAVSFNSKKNHKD